MRSIPQALAWETFSRSWTMLGCCVFGNVLPMLMYLAIATETDWKLSFGTNDFIWSFIRETFLPYLAMLCGLGITHAMGPMSRLYAKPIATSSIVALHLIPAAVILFIEVAASSWAVNLLFKANWPIIVNSVLAVVGWWWVQLILNTSKRSLLASVASLVPFVIFMVWMHTRYAHWNLMESERLLDFVHVFSISDVAILIMFTVGAYAWNVRVVSFDRCGESALSTNLLRKALKSLSHFDRFLDRKTPHFSSAAKAQNWYEWRQKGAVLPGLFLVLLTVMGLVWGMKQLQSTDSPTETWREFHEGILALGGILTVLGCLVGFIMGITGATSGRDPSISNLIHANDIFTLGGYQATLPASSAQLAKPILRTCGLSVLLAVGLWGILFCISVAIGLTLPSRGINFVPGKVGPVTLALMVLGPWVLMSNVAVICLTGRVARFLLSIISSLVAMVIVGEVISATLSDSAMENFQILCSGLVSLVLVAGGIAAYVYALRYSAVTSVQALIAGGIAIVIFLGSVVMLPTPPNFSYYIAMAAFAALVVTPFATTPLAIEWNRRR